MHNDTSLLISDKSSLFGFCEAGHLVLLGRILGAVLVTIHAFFLHDFSDFIGSRWISFIFLFGSLWLVFQHFKKKYPDDSFWLFISSFSLFFIPASILYVMWLVHFVPGSFNLFLVFISYYCLEKRSEKLKIKNGNLSGSALLYSCLAFLFLISAFFIYPPTALAVLLFTFLSILLAPAREWGNTRKEAIRDIMFVTLGMAVYWGLDHYFIRPLAIQSGKFVMPLQPEYSMEFAKSLLSKIPLLAEIIIISLSGPWHLWVGNGGAVLSLIMGVLSVIILKHKNRTKLSSPETMIILQKVLFLTMIFLLACAPMLLAGNYVRVLGYRLLFSSSAFFIFIQFFLLRKLDKLDNPLEKFYRWRIIAGGIILLYGFITCWHLADTVRNYSLELNFVRSEIYKRRDNFPKRIFVVKTPRGESLINRKMPFEFGFMITDMQHVTPIIADSLRHMKVDTSQLQLYLIDENQQALGQFEPDDLVIDLNQFRFEKFRESRVVAKISL